MEETTPRSHKNQKKRGVESFLIDGGLSRQKGVYGGKVGLSLEEKEDVTAHFGERRGRENYSTWARKQSSEEGTLDCQSRKKERGDKIDKSIKERKKGLRLP